MIGTGNPMNDLNIVIGMGVLEGPDYYTCRFIEYLRINDIAYHVVKPNDRETYTSGEFEEFISRPNTVVFTFNNVIFLLNKVLGNDFWKERGIPVFDYIVDHPRYYADTLYDPVCDIYVITPDENHKDFIEKYYPDIKGVFFSPHGGSKTREWVGFSDRKIDVLYMGDCKKAWDFPTIDILPEGVDFFNGVLRYLLDDPGLATEYAIEEFLKDKGLEYDKDLLLELNTKYANYVEELVRRYYMLEAVKVLDEADIHVDIYGKEWEDKDYRFSSNICIHGRISRNELMDRIADARISLCFIPWFKRGCSEKNFDSMLNGCLCISDKSEYLSSHYRDGYNIIYFDLNNPKQMAEDVKWLLANPQEAETIARRGYETAMRFDTWDMRFERITEYINKCLG